MHGVWDADRSRSVREALVASKADEATKIADDVLTTIDARMDDWSARYAEHCAALTTVADERDDARAQCLERRLQEIATWTDVLMTADVRVATNAVAVTKGLPGADLCSDTAFLATRVAPPAAAEARAIVDEIRNTILRAKTLQQSGHYDEALQISQDNLGRARSADYRPVLSEALVQLGSAFQGTGDYAAAETAYSEAYWIAKDLGIDRGTTAASTELTFIVGARLRRTDEGLEWGRHARASLDRSGNPPLWERQLERALAGIHHVGANFELAAQHTRASLKLAESIYGREHPQVAESSNNLGVMLQGQGEYEEAAAAFTRAIGIWEVAFGPEFPHIAAAHNNLCALMGELSRYDEAIEHGQHALALWTAVSERKHPRTASIHNHLGAAYHGSGDAAAARRHYEAALSIIDETLGSEHPNAAGVRLNLGGLAKERGDLEAAREHYRRCIEIFDAVEESEHPDAVTARRRLAALDQ